MTTLKSQEFLAMRGTMCGVELFDRVSHDIRRLKQRWQIYTGRSQTTSAIITNFNRSPDNIIPMQTGLGT